MATCSWIPVGGTGSPGAAAVTRPNAALPIAPRGRCRCGASIATYLARLTADRADVRCLTWAARCSNLGATAEPRSTRPTAAMRSRSPAMPKLHTGRPGHGRCAMNPSNGEALRRRSAPRRAMGRGPRLLREGAALDPRDLDAWYFSGRAYYDANRFERAIEAFEQALRMDAEQSRVYENLGLRRMRSGKFDAAEKSFRKAVELARGAWRPYLAYGAFLFRQGRAAESLPVLRQALALAPDTGRRPLRVGPRAVSRKQSGRSGARLEPALPSNECRVHNLMARIYSARGESGPAEATRSRRWSTARPCEAPSPFAPSPRCWRLAAILAPSAAARPLLRRSHRAFRHRLRAAQCRFAREAPDRDHGRRRGRVRLRQRRLSRHLFHQRRRAALARKDRPAVPQPPLPQQTRLDLRRRDRQSRSGRRRLQHRRRRGRLRQRRLRGPVRHRRQGQHPVPQSRRRHFRGRHSRGRPREP